MKHFLLSMLALACYSTFLLKAQNKFQISDEVEIVEINQNVYLQVSYKVSEQLGQIEANGLIYIDGDKAYIFDTPWNNEQTKTLLSWIVDSLQVTVAGFFPSHWHEDCMSGLSAIKEKKIKSYATTKYILELYQLHSSIINSHT